MIIKEIQAKSILTKSNLPATDFVINPYTGCSHGCIYCYARFMKRFTNHPEAWGNFVDVKTNAVELIPKNLNKHNNKSITLGSVTDPYQKPEEKYKITRNILKKIISFDSEITIITKSDLVTRDIDLLKKIKNLTVAFSISRADDKFTAILEPGAPRVADRIKAIKQLHLNGIRTAVFVSPIFPIISDWQEIIKKTKTYTDEYWFENLNIYPSIKNNLYVFLKNNFPELINEYRNIYSNEKKYWDEVKENIINFCQQENVKYKIFFHHQEIRR